MFSPTHIMHRSSRRDGPWDPSLSPFHRKGQIGIPPKTKKKPHHGSSFSRTLPFHRRRYSPFRSHVSRTSNGFFGFWERALVFFFKRDPPKHGSSKRPCAGGARHETLRTRSNRTQGTIAMKEMLVYRRRSFETSS